MLIGVAIHFLSGGGLFLSNQVLGASLYWSVEQSGYRGLPHTGVPEIVSPLYPDYSTLGVRKISGTPV